MHCKNCGRKITSYSEKCPFCGVSQIDEEQQYSEFTSCNYTSSRRKSILNNLPWLFWCFSLILCIGSMIYYYIFFIFLPDLYFKQKITDVETESYGKYTFSSPDLVNVSEIHFCKNSLGERAVCGMAENTTDKMYGVVKLDFDFFNKQGVVIGQSVAEFSNLPPKIKIRFQTEGYTNKKEEPYSFEIKNITIFKDQ